nr:tetratricopeptide repeat protein [Nitrosomonas nitrosa]
MPPHSLLLSLAVVSALVLVDVNPSEAIDTPQQLKLACEKGDATACTSLGMLHVEGEGVEQNNFQAAALFRKACDGGDALGCGSLGFLYEYGGGVRQDNAEALKYFGKVCDLKVQVGCDNYARLKLIMDGR